MSEDHTSGLTVEEIAKLRKRQEEEQRKVLEKQLQQADFSLGKEQQHLRIPSLPNIKK